MSPGPLAERLNRLSEEEAREVLLRCCGSERWAATMASARPFRSDEAVLREADRAWWSLGEEEWHEAFAAHPRIGERALRERWSAQEQAGVEGAPDSVLDALAEGNRAYEARFGWIFLISASGMSAAEMLAALRDRLSNDPAEELRVAAREQAEITRVRLRKLGSEDPDETRRSAGPGPGSAEDRRDEAEGGRKGMRR